MVQRHEQRCFHSEILQAVVRRLRTTPRKLSHSDSTVCAFAPRRRDRGQLGRGEESCIIIHHDKWSSITPGKVNMLVLHPPENASDIPWCKDTNGGVSPWDSAGCGAKASHHTPPALAFRFHGMCLCTTGEETAASCAVTRSLALPYMMIINIMYDAWWSQNVCIAPS